MAARLIIGISEIVFPATAALFELIFWGILVVISTIRSAFSGAPREMPARPSIGALRRWSAQIRDWRKARKARRQQKRKK